MTLVVDIDENTLWIREENSGDSGKKYILDNSNSFSRIKSIGDAIQKEYASKEGEKWKRFFQK